MSGNICRCGTYGRIKARSRPPPPTCARPEETAMSNTTHLHRVEVSRRGFLQTSASPAAA
jgi:hypothetical protein